MEYIRPLAPPSLAQRLHMFFLDLLFVCACLRRFAADHLLTPHSPQPQPKAADKAALTRRREESTKTATVAEGGVKTSTASSSSPPSPSPSPPYQLRVLNLNIWGLPISPRTDVRARELTKSFHLFDVIAFQELSHEREVSILHSGARAAGLHHMHQFTQGVGFPIWHGVTAPGLVVFSRYPILDTHFKRYSINGKPYQAAHADYMLAKGVGLVRLDVSSLAYPHDEPDQCRPVIGVDVFLTHLHANYTDYCYDWRKWLPLVSEMESRLRRGGDLDSCPSLPIPVLEHVGDEYLAHRVLQAYECARFIASSRRADFLTLLCGDINCTPNDICMQIIQNVTFGFREVHPFSRGFTCGAKDNSFTFSTEPIRMERRSIAEAEVADEERDTIAHLNRGVGGFDSTSAESTRGSQLVHRRFADSPSNPTLAPADAAVVSRTTFGEHVTLMPSSATADTKSTAAADADSTPQKPIATAANGSAACGPLAWRAVDTPTRIDYVLYANPSTRVRCACSWRRVQLPFHDAASDDDAAADTDDDATSNSSCRCPVDARPPPSRTWRVAAASVFKQYMMEPDGRMMSISDHHGLSVTMQFRPQEETREASRVRAQPTSTIIISQLPATTTTSTNGACDPPSASSTESFSVTQSPLVCASRMPAGVEPMKEEDELFTLDDTPRALSVPSHRSRSPSAVAAAAAASVPVLSMSSILLLSEGVLWFGLRDASDRRSAHLRRMLRAFLVFVIGSRAMWMYLLNIYFEDAMADLLPAAVLDFPFPSSLITLMRFALFCIDWAHTFLPIYIVLEYLLTTFPAKDEQMACRQTIAEMAALRKFVMRHEVTEAK